MSTQPEPKSTLDSSVSSRGKDAGGSNIFLNNTILFSEVI